MIADFVVATKYRAAETLGYIGISTPAVVDALIHALENDPVTYVKESAIQSLVRLNVKDEKTLKAISAMMTSSVDDEVKMIAAESLEALQASNKGIMDVFIYTLKSGNVVDLRMRAAAALAR